MLGTYPPRVVVSQAGYRRERLPGDIVVMRLLDSQRETLDAWYTDCHKVMQAWRPGRRLRYLHDIRRAEQITPYATERVLRVLRRMRGVEITDGRGAILLQNETLSALLGTFVRRRGFAAWQIGFYSDEQAALRWLAE